MATLTPRSFLRFTAAVVATGLFVVPAPARAAEYKVVLLGGQSNMDGRAATSSLPTSPVNLKNPQSDVTYYNGYSASNGYTGGNLSTLRPGATQFGPEVTFGRAIADADPTAHYALLKYAVGGTSLSVDWRAPTPSSPTTGAVYGAFKTAIADGLGDLTARGDTYKIVGMLWLQGESDSSAAAAYRANLGNFIADVRSTYGANLPFVIGGIGYDSANSATVSAAQADAAATTPFVRYFTDDDLRPTPTALHFDAAGQQAIGGRFATALRSVPEPGSAGLLAAGAIAALGRRRRRHRCWRRVRA